MEQINYIRHLNAVLSQFEKDHRLNPAHISLYLALFQLWNYNYFKKEFFVSREEVMSLAKIGSKSTYHRSIKDLSNWKYIRYLPSHNPFKGSRIEVFQYGTSTEQAVYPHCPKSETSSGQAVVPIKKHIQTIENTKTARKRENSFLKISEKKKNRSSRVPHPDNLSISVQKKYDKPL